MKQKTKKKVVKKISMFLIMTTGKPKVIETAVGKSVGVMVELKGVPPEHVLKGVVKEMTKAINNESTYSL